jgi:tetratricopeptide (TPR) repeat protein
MRILNRIHKRIVTALLSTMLFSLPLAAQDVTVDDLFDALRTAPVVQSERIARQITKRWSKSGSASMDLLLNRGRAALESGNTAAAIDHFSALIDHAPEFAQAYNMRGAAYFRADLYGPALLDVGRAIALEPRHFKAMQGLAAIQEAMGKPEKALETYREVLEIMPQNTEARAAVARLEDVAL